MGALYLGLDLSTQSVKAEVVNENLEIVHEASVNFDTDLPEFRTSGGANRDDKNPKVVTAQPIMWIKALDITLEKLRLQGLKFDEIVGISGAGQQHGSVYWKRGGNETLKNMDPGKFLHEELGLAFTLPYAPIWMDSSTTEYCVQLEKHVGGPQELSRLTGSRAYERFTGSQIAKIIHTRRETYNATERISLVSSFVCSLFLGAYAEIDYSDGSGMNLLDIRTKEWSRVCLEGIIPECNDDKIDELVQKLGKPVPSETVQGTISNYFVERFGFNPDCKIVTFTGDNPSSFAALRLRPNDIAVSLGTSDTLFLSMDTLPETAFTEGHIFANPISSHNNYMALLCFKNGSLTRERICRDTAEGSWDLFDQLLETTPKGNFGNVGFYFDLQEILPKVNAGDYRFNKIGEKLIRFASKEVEVRALIEGQFLAKKIHALKICNITKDTRILATGGASNNKFLLQVLSDIFSAPVYVQETSNSASIGACYRVKYSLDNEAGHEESPAKNGVNGNGNGCENGAGDLCGSGDTHSESDPSTEKAGEWRLICSPSEDALEIYDSLMERYRILEDSLHN